MKSMIENQPISRLYSYFSLGLAILFISFYFLEEQLQWWQTVSPILLPIALSAYLTVAISAIVATHRKKAATADQMLPYLMWDILFFGFLMLYLSPTQTDVYTIMLITVALGSFLVKRLYGYLLAAMATIMVLSNGFIHPNSEVTGRLLSSSFMSIVYFITAAVIQSLAKRFLEARSRVQKTEGKLLTASRINSIIIDRMQTGVCVVNKSGKILSLNRSVQERIKSSVIGDNIPDIIFERMAIWQEYKLQNDDAIILQIADNQTFTFMISFAEINDMSTLIFIEDKDMVTRRANQFKLESLARMAASIAHEIRNPLNAVSHAAQLIQDNPALDKDDVKLCDIIVNQSMRMDAIIQNVLQISKRRSSELKWLDLESWMTKFVNDFTQQNSVAFNVSSLQMKIRFDPSQLHQVLWNICSNAVRYGLATIHAPIKIEFKQQKHRASIKIFDNGPGISEQELKYLFEPFHTTSASGTGLGLYLVKELCQANHAEVSYCNLPEGGACFEVLFAPDFSHKTGQR
ncbi:MAG: two-component system sensor histidine kinase PilS (NtrC family) [Bermanella sp.]|jgi:two-component system sensor histidine kinase PilS (NtrC family)